MTIASSRTALALALCVGLTASAPLSAQGAYPMRNGPHPVSIDTNVMVKMRDGVRLATDIYRPIDVTGPVGAIVMRTPYGKGAAPAVKRQAAMFASHGFVALVQDVRGKFSSEGEYRVYNGDLNDWPDLFDWIGAQPWSNKKIASFGCSYVGEQQIIAAQTNHPLYVAAVPLAAGGNLGRVGRSRTFWGSVEGGANAVSINFGWMPVWASLDKGQRPAPKVDFATILKSLPLIDMTDRAGSPSPDWRNFLERGPDDPWWDRQGYLTADAKVSVAALHVSSWFDMANQMLEERAIFEKNATNARARDNQYAIIAPTTHCSFNGAGSDTKAGDLMVGDARLHYWDLYVQWFDRWLNGNEHAFDGVPKVQYFTIGRGVWKTSDRWPVAGMTPTTFYLHSPGNANTSRGGGTLSEAKPTNAEKPDTFTYDPANPVPSRGGSICCTGNPKDQPGSFDQSDIESRPDVLTYSMDVPATGLELTGPIQGFVDVSTDVPDTDVTMKLVDVFPDGRAMNIVEAITRARYRESYGKPVMMTPGKVYEVPVDLHATSWYLPAGHKLRVEVSSSNFPRFDRNLNTGGKNYDETTWKVAHTAVHHGAASASRLVLPVVK